MAQLRRNRLSGGARFAQVLTEINTLPFSKANNVLKIDSIGKGAES